MFFGLKLLYSFHFQIIILTRSMNIVDFFSREMRSSPCASCSTISRGFMSLIKLPHQTRTAHFMCSIIEHNKEHKSNTGPHTRQVGHMFTTSPREKRSSNSHVSFSLLYANFPGENKSTCDVLYWERGGVAEHSCWTMEMVDSTTFSHFQSLPRVFH
jgi:hypothetical protein